MTASTNHLASKIAARTYADDPADATVARQIGWVQMAQNFLALVTLISGTGILTFKIFAATDSSGSNPTEVKAHATPTTADAADDMLALEVSAEECLAALKAAGYTPENVYVSVQMDNDTNTDINAVTYIREGARFSYEDMTDDVVA